MSTSSEVPASGTVRFEHSFFSTNAGGFFRMDETGRRPVYVIELGEQTAVVPFQSIRQAFGQGDFAADEAMLDTVAESLKFVQKLRVGDPLPSEITNGEASWEPEEIHRTFANRRVVAAMLKWSGEYDGDTIDTVQLRQFLTGQIDKEKVAQALDRLESSIATGGDGSSDIQTVLAGLTEELSYIEALREKVLRIKQIGKVLEQARRTGGGQANNAQDASAVLRVFNHMMQGFNAKLATVDVKIADIYAAISEHRAVCKHIRQVRDDLRYELLAWDNPLEQWDNMTSKNFDVVDLASKIGDLYRFLAPLYSPVDEWERMDGYQEQAAPDAETKKYASAF